MMQVEIDTGTGRFMADGFDVLPRVGDILDLDSGGHGVTGGGYKVASVVFPVKWNDQSYEAKPPRIVVGRI